MQPVSGPDLLHWAAAPLQLLQLTAVPRLWKAAHGQRDPTRRPGRDCCRNALGVRAEGRVLCPSGSPPSSLPFSPLHVPNPSLSYATREPERVEAATPESR